MRSSPLLVRLALLVAALACGVASPLMAQVPRDSLPFAPAERPVPLESWLTSAPTATLAPLLDGPIERADYRLGPGDLVNISLFGDLDRLLTTRVTPEGTLVLPSIGIVSVLGLDLDEAQAQVRGAIERFYRNVQVELTLLEVRSFRIFLVGDVPEPGMREAVATTRLSEIVPLRGPEGIIQRNIRIRRASGDSLHIDLARFVQMGDLAQNPLLQAGDAILVPVTDETITLAGRLAYPGTYEYRRDDTLAGILRVANGGAGFPAGAADSIRIARFLGPNEREVRILSREEAIGAPGESFPLRPFDAIYVPEVSNYKAQRSATVLGAVRRPGLYPIRPDTTTVYELIEMAGGFTEEASLVDAILRRGPVYSPLDSVRLLQNIPPELLSREEQRILQVTARGDEGRVVVDFERLALGAGDPGSEVIQNADLLYIPERRNEVTVLGAVVQPGIVGHIPGASAREYIARTGGYSRRAARGDVVVIKARLGSRLEPGEAGALEPGDRIIVPFREPRTFLETMQAGQSIVSVISGFVLTALAMKQIF